MTTASTHLQVRRLGVQPYHPLWRAMQAFTTERVCSTPDELWLLEHPPVYTLGMNASAEHLLAAPHIPVIRVDRGGQVTYHGPGQLVVYVLVDLRRLQLGVRQLITRLEQAVVDLLALYGVQAYARPEAPGVYVAGRKLASLGLRVRRSCSYHGLSLNVAMDLTPFGSINPCGYPGLEITQLRDLGIDAAVADVGKLLLGMLMQQFRYDTVAALAEYPGPLNQEIDYA